ncbi:hypothetical protein HK099_001956, partial [Clydaea vesicula]
MDDLLLKLELAEQMQKKNKYQLKSLTYATHSLKLNLLIYEKSHNNTLSKNDSKLLSSLSKNSQVQISKNINFPNRTASKNLLVANPNIIPPQLSSVSQPNSVPFLQSSTTEDEIYSVYFDDQNSDTLHTIQRTTLPTDLKIHKNLDSFDNLDNTLHLKKLNRST